MFHWRNLVASFLLFTAGCVYVPTGESAYDVVDLRKTFGAQRSPGTLEPGLTTRADVARVVALSPKYNPDGADAPVWVLVDPNCRGFVMAIDMIPFGPSRARDYFARVEFDDRDVVRAFELRRDRDWRDAGRGAMVGERQWLAADQWPLVKRETELVVRRDAPLR